MSGVDVPDTWRVLDGDPGLVRWRADELRQAADTLDRLTRLLTGLGVAAVWDSPAGTTFATHVAAVPDRAGRVAARFADAADLATRYADRLEAAQTQIAGALDKAREAATEQRLCLEASATAAPGSPEQAVLQERERQALSDLTEATSRYEIHAQEIDREERDLARALHGVCDQLDDPRGYDLGEAVGSVGRSRLFDNPVVGWVPVLKPVEAVGTGLDVTGQVILKAGYDEGSWSQIGINGLGLGADLVVKGTSHHISSNRLPDTGPPGRPGSVVSAGGAAPAGAAGRTGSTAVRRRLPVQTRAVRKARAKVDELTGVELERQIAADWREVVGGPVTVQAAQRLRAGGRRASYVDKTAGRVEAADGAVRSAGSRLAGLTGSETDTKGTRRRSRSGSGTTEQRGLLPDPAPERPAAGQSTRPSP